MSDQYAATPVAVNALLLILATAAIALRIVSRKISNVGFWWDDWLAILALPFAATMCITFLAAGFHGLGSHGGDPIFFLHVLFYNEIWYMMVLVLTKLSVLCFYRRIFTVSRYYRITLWVIGAFVLVWWAVFFLATILQCIPISANWEQDSKATCVFKDEFFLAQAIPNIIVDFVLLILPLPQLWALQMNTSKKIALVAVFALGYLNPIISIIRLTTFVGIGANAEEDINFFFLEPSLWSSAEVVIAIVSCSIPSMASIFQHFSLKKKNTPTKKKQSSFVGSDRSEKGLLGSFISLKESLKEKTILPTNSHHVNEYPTRPASIYSTPAISVGAVGSVQDPTFFSACPPLRVTQPAKPARVICE